MLRHIRCVRVLNDLRWLQDTRGREQSRNEHGGEPFLERVEFFRVLLSYASLGGSKRSDNAI